MTRIPALAMLVLMVAGGVTLLATALQTIDRQAGAAELPDVREIRLTLAVHSSDGAEFLEISMFAVDDGSGDVDRNIAEGKAAMLARFPGASEVEPAEVSAQFKLFGIRWRDPTASWFYNPDGVTGALPAESALAAISAGADAWDGAGGTPWKFEYAGETTTATGCNGIPEAIPRDGINVVGWGHIAGGFLGYACWWRSASLVDATPYFEAVEFDIVFEPIFPYSQASLKALAVHEFGHALGLDHTEPSLCPGSAMCGGEGAMIFSEPQADDLWGLVALYGFAPTPTPTATLTPPPATATPTMPPLPRRSLLPAIARD